MDQLRDTISFRAYSQQDPRIEFKREGSRLFRTMQQTIRDRVCDLIFRARVTPFAAAPPPPPPPQRAPQPRPAPAAPAARPLATAGGAIAGPGMSSGTSPYYEPPAPAGDGPPRSGAGLATAPGLPPASAEASADSSKTPTNAEPADRKAEARAQLDAARAALAADKRKTK